MPGHHEFRGENQAAIEHSRLYLYEPDSFVPLALVNALGMADAASAPKAEAEQSRQDQPSAAADDIEDDFIAELRAAKAQLNRPIREQRDALRGKAEQRQAERSSAQRATPSPKPQASRIFYYHCDHLGTPQELTDSAGNLVWAADYAAWGKVRKIERPQPPRPQRHVVAGNTALKPEP